MGGVLWAIALIGCFEEPVPSAGSAPSFSEVPLAPGEAPLDAATHTLQAPPTSGRICRGAAECPSGPYRGKCLCTQPIPDGPIETTGLCWNGRIRPNAWWCVVEDGHAFPRGLIIPE